MDLSIFTIEEITLKIKKNFFCQIPGTVMSQTHTKTLLLLFLNKITVAQNMKVYDIDWYRSKK